MCVLEGHFGCYAVNDVCHFGPQVLEDVGDMYPRFLCWLPKYHLSMPSKCSLQVWRMVIDNLTVDDVIFFFFFFFFFFFLFLGFCFWLRVCVMFSFVLCGLISFHSRFFVIFMCLWILSLDVRSMLCVNRLKS